MPKVSVVMGIYNEPIEWMRQSIDSILNQTFSDFEFIIINDNPSRIENCGILDEYSQKDSRIIVITNDINIGLTKSLNKGLQIARGEYIARMDADDIALPYRLHIQYMFMIAHPCLTVSGSNAFLFGDISIGDSKKLVMPDTNSKIQIYSIFLNPLIHPSVIFSREHLKDLRYNESCKRGQDYEFWVRLMTLGHKVQNNNQFLLKYRRVDKGSGYFFDQNQTANIARIQSLENAVGKNYAKKHSDIHMYVCGGMSNTSYSIHEVELYLEELRLLLIKKYSDNEQWIIDVVGYIWQLNCSRAKEYRSYFRSSLYVFSSFKDVLKMIVRFLLNIVWELRMHLR